METFHIALIPKQMVADSNVDLLSVEKFGAVQRRGGGGHHGFLLGLQPNRKSFISSRTR